MGFLTLFLTSKGAVVFNRRYFPNIFFDDATIVTKEGHMWVNTKCSKLFIHQENKEK